ncbi:hypothetical protein BHYA_0078g00160 [Botrytis hyacinthi]|uniref:Uncharacterized protein n=1 Tax=Botrytis hyacinthi TaxID=278943 RepID=A0A4Z1GMU8_9HELO|nr:hypothetical protein BHYA_0078g00160 [Botrytis hyacinthi]
MNASPATEKATTTVPTVIPAFAPPLRPLFSEVDMDAGVADVVEIIDCVTEALVVAVLEADEDVWVERIGVGDVVEVDEEAPLMTKNPVPDISWELQLYTELRSLNRRSYFASPLSTLVGIVIVQS